MVNHEDQERAINSTRKKWENAERLVIDCDPKSVYALSEVDILLERYKEYEHGRQWKVLLEDQESIKKEFATTCTCKSKK